MGKQESDFRDFLATFESGLHECADATPKGTGRDSADRPDVSTDSSSPFKSAIARLKTTAYGHRLMDEEELSALLETLEAGLGHLTDRMLQHPDGAWTDEHEAIQWAQDPRHECERVFRFWGGMGRILYFFRDQGLSLVVRPINTITFHAASKSNFFQRNTTGAAFISSMPFKMRALSSQIEATRIWRKKVRAIFEKAHSIRLSQEPCLGV